MPYSNTVVQVRNALQKSFDEIYPWFDFPSTIREYKPLDGGWSINEILEHVTLTTHFLLIVVRNSYPKAIKRSANRVIEDGESDLDKLVVIGEHRSFGWIRPGHMEPNGEKPILGIRDLMREQQQESLKILEMLKNGEGSLFRVRMSVNNTGHIDLYQWLYFIAQHAKRHINQMKENVEEQEKLTQE